MLLTEQTEKPRPTIFRKCWASCNNEMNVILPKHGKGGGRAVGCHHDNWSFIPMLLCLFVFVSLLHSFSRCLFVFFFFYIQGNKFNIDGISYYITCLCLHLFVQRRSMVR